MSDLRPQKTGWKQLRKMTKEELLYEVRRLDEVIQVTSRRLDTSLSLTQQARLLAENWRDRFCPAFQGGDYLPWEHYYVNKQ
jgi:hypothetical protein